MRSPSTSCGSPMVIFSIRVFYSTAESSSIPAYPFISFENYSAFPLSLSLSALCAVSSLIACSIHLPLLYWNPWLKQNTLILCFVFF